MEEKRKWRERAQVERMAIATSDDANDGEGATAALCPNEGQEYPSGRVGERLRERMRLEIRGLHSNQDKLLSEGKK